MEFTRISNSSNGAPRYVVHFLSLLTDEEKLGDIFPNNLDRITNMYRFAVNRARQIGGKRYHTKSYGGGIVFSFYGDIAEKEAEINDLLNNI